VRTNQSNQAGGPRQGYRASPLKDRRVLAIAGLLVLIAGYYAFQAWSRSSERAASRRSLMADAHAEIIKIDPDLDVLSSLMARLKRSFDDPADPELLAIQAEIQLSRNRPEGADRLFGTIAASPSATPDQKRLGSRILIKKQQGFAGDATESEAMLGRVLTMSLAAYADGKDHNDLFRAWQAAARMWDPRAKELAGQLAQAAPESPQNRLANLFGSFDPSRDSFQVDELDADFDRPPMELQAMKVLVTLFRDKDLPTALSAAEEILSVSPSVPSVRLTAAVVLHACVMGKKEEGADASVFVGRRDAQLDWLDARAPTEERAKWDPMRSVR
jgi:hypothetical protein